MFKRTNRLSKTKDVQVTTKHGRSFFGPSFVIKYLQSPQDTRLTVVVSTKVSKRAVVRNRIKRIIRDELRKHFAGLKPGDYVIIVKPSAASVESKDLRESLTEVMKKTKLI
jgi:ribonuclease P protein component